MKITQYNYNTSTKKVHNGKDVTVENVKVTRCTIIIATLKQEDFNIFVQGVGMQKSNTLRLTKPNRHSHFTITKNHLCSTTTKYSFLLHINYTWKAIISAETRCGIQSIVNEWKKLQEAPECRLKSSTRTKDNPWKLERTITCIYRTIFGSVKSQIVS